jgi:hypothetical protein
VRSDRQRLYLTGLSAHVVRKDGHSMRKMPLTSLILLGQGAMYFATGVWPLVSRRTFEKVTGPKTDWWLVKTVGLVITAAGGSMLVAGAKRRTTPEVALLAIGAAAGLTAIDIGYVAKNRISPVYLLDAAAEMGLLASWAVALNREGYTKRNLP